MKLFIWLIPIVSRYNLERWIISLNLNKVIVHDIDITIYAYFHGWKYRFFRNRIPPWQRISSQNWKVPFVSRFYVFSLLHYFRSHNECDSIGHTYSNKYSSILQLFRQKFYILHRGPSYFHILHCYRIIILLKYVNLEFSNIEVVASQLICGIYQTKNYL